MLARIPSNLSAGLAAIERPLLMVLIAAIGAFVLMNVLLRMIGITVAWADEMAIYAMTLSGFIGASLMLRARIDPAVLLLHEVLPARATRALSGTVSLVAAAFGAGLLYLTWRWFDPLALIASGFDISAFEGTTFNFVYTDSTPIMGLPTWWFYIVMPWFGFTVLVHAFANLMEDMGLTTRPADPAGLAMDAPS